MPAKRRGGVVADGGNRVLVIGGGFAGLCAAIDAREAGAAVMLVDAAPRELLGGNARHCRNLRLVNPTETPFQRDSYPAAAFLADLRRKAAPDPDLAERLAEGAGDLGPWLLAQGVAFEPWADGNLPYSRRTVFLRGGGQALVNALVRRAVALGVDIRTGWRVRALDPAALSPQTAAPLHILADTPEGPVQIAAAAVVLACGGTGANRGELARHLGPRAAVIANRGTPFQQGEPLLWLLSHGAAAAGLPGDGHLVPVDARAPQDDAGIVSRLDGMQFGLVVGPDGRRLGDEGATISPERFSHWARLLQDRPDPRGWIILGPEGTARLPPLMYPPLRAATPVALALACGIDPDGLTVTLQEIRDWQAGGPPPDPPRTLRDTAPLGRLDGPLAAIPMRLGLAFTRHGAAVDASTRIRLAAGGTAPQLFAAGTAMCGQILGPGYLSGMGLTIAGVFGRIAGREAAALAGSAVLPAQGPALADRIAPSAPPPEDPLANARRTMNLCNTCGFCTGLCDVFPAAQLRQGLRDGDLRHLAHLCHDCRSCHADCQYTLPHELAINVPAALAEVRAQDYAGPLPRRPAGPRFAVWLFLFCLFAPVLGTLLLVPSQVLFAPQAGSGAFYRVIPHPVMAAGAALAFAGAGVLLVARVWRHWRRSGGPATRHSPATLVRALTDAATLRNLGHGAPGCEDRQGRVSLIRRLAHHLVAYGFALTFLATLAGAWLHSRGQVAPYPVVSLPVLLGAIGGLAMLAGLTLLERRSRSADQAPASARMLAEDRFARAQLAAVAGSGLLLLALRETPVMGLMLALHLGSVLGFALLLPFGKLSHGGWRFAALLRHAGERAARRPRPGQADKPDAPGE
ncbi:hypothetical protein B6K69_17030 [Fuscovulum blasticum]|nr:hypothetical protein B6K69_17030 [Fuscovulum blasticum]